jgi:hypothetical protein
LCGHGCDSPAAFWKQSAGAVPARQDRCRGHNLVHAIRKEDGQARRILKEKSRCQDHTREKLLREDRSGQLRASLFNSLQRPQTIRSINRQNIFSHRRVKGTIRQVQRPQTRIL